MLTIWLLKRTHETDYYYLHLSERPIEDYSNIRTADSMNEARSSAIQMIDQKTNKDGWIACINRGSKNVGYLIYDTHFGYTFHYPKKFGGYAVYKNGKIPKFYKGDLNGKI